MKSSSLDALLEPPRIVAFSCMRNEGPRVLEWFAHHRLLGVDHFLIYTNDCEDGTDLIWKRLEELGYATHRDNPPDPEKPESKAQWRAFMRAQTDPVYRSADWILALDADEFLNVHCEDGHILDLLAQNPAVDCIVIHWRLFGTGGHKHLFSGLLMEELQYGGDPKLIDYKNASYFKSLFRRARFRRAGVHLPVFKNPNASPRFYALPSGQDIPPERAVIVENIEYSHAQINHYSVPSLEDLFLKTARGFAAGESVQSLRSYLKRRDLNHLCDTSIWRYLPAVKQEMARLLEDPQLAQLHAEACALRQGKLDEIMAASPENRRRFRRLRKELFRPPQG